MGDGCADGHDGGSDVRDDASEASEAGSQRGPQLKQSLLRKVSQLSKVVVQLNNRIADGDARCEKVLTASEEEIATITKDASLKVASYRKQVTALSHPASLAEEAARCAAPWQHEVEAAKGEFLRLQQLHDVECAKIISEEKDRLISAARQLRALTSGLRAATLTFQQVAEKSRTDLERRDAEFQSRRSEELQSAQAEHEKKCKELEESQAREVVNLEAQREQALAHLRRLHESEFSTLQMQALQRRRDKVHRIEQDFAEERRSLEQLIAHVQFELVQQQRDADDVGTSGASVQLQIDTMQVALSEMKARVDQAEVEALQAREEVSQREAEVATLQSEVAVLQVRQQAGRGHGRTGKTAQEAGDETSSKGAALSSELREAILGAKRFEMELQQRDAESANLDDELAEQEKQVEVLEVELEEERLRTQQLQEAVRRKEAVLTR